MVMKEEAPIEVRVFLPLFGLGPNFMEEKGGREIPLNDGIGHETI